MPPHTCKCQGPMDVGLQAGWNSWKFLSGYLLLIEPGSWSLTTSGHVSRGGNIGASTQLIRLVMLLATATAMSGGLRWDLTGLGLTDPPQECKQPKGLHVLRSASHSCYETRTCINNENLCLYTVHQPCLKTWRFKQNNSCYCKRCFECSKGELQTLVAQQTFWRYL